MFHDLRLFRYERRVDGFPTPFQSMQLAKLHREHILIQGVNEILPMAS